MSTHIEQGPGWVVWHIFGTPWDESPLPRRWHKCQPYTFGRFGIERVYRCACGGIRMDGSRRWSERNSRRSGR